MNREEKSATIQEIAAQIEGSEAIFAVDYRGISVPQAAELRSKLREADASFRIVKNRLTKIAADQAGEARLAEVLQGPTALTFVRGDTAAAAKALSSFHKEHDILAYKGGFMGDTALDSDSFKAISRLPGREVLIGQFAGVVASPISGVVRGLNALIQGLASQLGQIADQGLVSGEAPAAPAEETPAAEPAAEAETEAPAEEGSAEEAAPEASAENETSSDDDQSSDDETSKDDAKEEE